MAQHAATPDHKPQSTERSALLNSEQRHQSYTHPDVEHGTKIDNDKRPCDDGPSTSHLILVLGSIWIGSFLTAIDSTIIATLAVPISSEFDSQKLLSWLATAYLIAQTALTPLSGRLTDIFGRRAGLIFSNLAFLTGNLICGLAKEEWVMVLGRVIAGVGGGGINSISAFIATDLIPLRRRGFWQGISNIMWGVGAGLGGVYGGWIHDLLGWRWAFLTQIPFTVVSMGLIILVVKIPVRKSDKPKIKRIDFLGSFLLVTALVSFLLGISVGGNILPWDHYWVILSLVASLFFLVAFVYVEEHKALEPIIPMRLLLNSTVAAACLTNFFDTMVEYTLHYYGPIYFQVLGYGGAKSGSLLVLQAIGVGCGSISAGYIMSKTGRYWALNISLEGLKLTAAVLLALTTSRTSALWPPFIYYFVCGFTFAGMLTTALVALVSAIDHEDQALATSASYTFRYMGSALGVNIASTVFQNVLNHELWKRLDDGRPNIGKLIEDIRNSMDRIRNLPLDRQNNAYDAYMDAVRGVWYTVVICCALSLVVSFFIKQHKLHSRLSREE